MIKVEVCINCDNEQGVRDSVGAALQGGASTVELCSAMHLDGLTPEREHIREARESFQSKNGLMVMIRPRSGNFYYSGEELQLMQRQIKTAAEQHADGVVFGVLRKKDNSLDVDSLNMLMETSRKYNLKVTFHRAFDASPDPLEILELVINAGVDRILTSGTSWNVKKPVIEGISTVKKIIERAQGRIVIVIGGGINIDNVEKIITRLPLEYNNISVHAYSGVQENGFTTVNAVTSLVKSIEKIGS